MTVHTSTLKVEKPRIDGFVVGVALVGFVTLAGLIALETAPFLVALFLLGGVLGVALYHGAFGFTAGWRQWVLTGSGAGLRAQLLLLGVASLLMVPVIAYGVNGSSGTIAPVGVSLVVGAFLFGVGMQLGGGCGSGTLFTVGAGNWRMVMTLVFFIVGSLIGTFHLPWWLDRPAVDPIVLYHGVGPWGAIGLQWFALAGLWWLVQRRERRLLGTVTHGLYQRAPNKTALQTLFTGQWPLLWAVLVLALGNLLTLLISGSPWGVTFAFALWGAKIAQAAGMDLSQTEFWTWDYPALALADSVLVNVTSVMNFGLLLGAMLAAGLANRFHEASQNPLVGRSVLAAILGGLLMGYGARLGFGCNIGAMFSGIASASLHGWLWFAAAFAGSWLGIHLRPRFGL